MTEIDPDASDWIDEFIRGAAQHAAERMGLVPRTSANDPGPVHINLDDEAWTSPRRVSGRRADQAPGVRPDEAPANLDADPDKTEEVPF